MANWDNQHTKTVQEEMIRLFENGMVLGYESPIFQMQPFFSKPYNQMKISERGYIVGREIRMMEERGEG